MAFDGSYVYNLPVPAYPAIAGEVISATYYNTILEDIKEALTVSYQAFRTFEDFFPLINGNILASEEEINKLVGSSFSAADLEAVITMLAAKTLSSTGGKLDNFPTGTVLSFFQAAPPTGWTLNTANNDAFLRVRSTTGGGTGGSVSAATLAHVHTMGTHVHSMGTHLHKWYDNFAGTSDATFNSSGTLIYLNAYSGPSSYAHILISSTGDGPTIDCHTNEVDPGDTNATDPGDTNSTSINPKYVDVVMGVKS